jgi:hypothetical protein
MPVTVLVGKPINVFSLERGKRREQSDVRTCMREIGLKVEVEHPDFY